MPHFQGSQTQHQGINVLKTDINWKWLTHSICILNMNNFIKVTGKVNACGWMQTDRQKDLKEYAPNLFGLGA